MSDPPIPLLAFGAFCALLGDDLGVDLSSATPEALLVDDLALDSLAMIEVIVVLADLGVTLPEALIPELRTMGDLHHYYVTLSPRPAGTDEGIATPGQVWAS